jgi:glycosyltransferase involved in cell wall biosynthesis
LVSVVTPSLNQGRFIRKAIESVLSQDYSHIEHWVIDGGSTDGTIGILREYGDRIRWVSEPDRGQAAAVNKGWARASGDILGWLNADDAYTPGAVKRAVDYLLRHPDALGVYGKACWIDEEERVIGTYPTFASACLKTMKGRCGVCQPTVFLRRGAVEAAGGLREDLQMVMDYDLWMRLLRGGRLGYLEQDQALSRLHPETKTARGARDRARETYRMMRDNCFWVHRVCYYDLVYYRQRERPGGALSWRERAGLRGRQMSRWFWENVLGAPARALFWKPRLKGDLRRG